MSVPDQPAQSATSRWPWAYVIATALAAVVWYLGRADVLALTRDGEPAFRVTSTALPTNAAFLMTFVAFGVVPVLLAPSVLDRSAHRVGLGLGDGAEILKLLSWGAPAALFAGYIASNNPTISAVYPLGGQVAAAPGPFVIHAGGYLLYYLGFEYLFRGFLLLGTKDDIGAPAANLLQACLATAFHFGKPGLEMAAVFPASLIFGWATLRTGSIWCALIVHGIVGVSVDWFLVFGR